MANANIKFDDNEWRKFLASVLGAAKDMSAILGVAYATKGIADIQQHFRDEKGPEGPWTPRSYFTEYNYAKISEGTYKPPKGTSRAQYNIGNKILHMTGQLSKSFLRNGWSKKSNTAIEAFSNDKKSGLHDNGGPFKAWGKHNATMPARPFMWLSNPAKEVMAQIILDKLAK